MPAGFKKYVFWLAIFTLAIGGLHFVIAQWLADSYIFYAPLWGLYLFLALLTLSGFLLVLWVHGRLPDKTAAVFVATGFFKMLAAVLFLLPLIQNTYHDMIAQVLTFFIPYFLYLGFDTFHTVRLLR